MSDEQQSDNGQHDNGPQGQAPQGQSQQQDNGRQTQTGQKDDKQRSRKPLIILAIIVVILAIAGILYAIATADLIRTDDAYTEGNVVTMAPKVSGYVIKLNVDDNSFVHAGDLLLQIDPRDYMAARDEAMANLQLAQAQLVAAKAGYDIARVQYPARLAQAEAQKKQSEAQRFQAEQEYQRQHSVDVRATTRENIDTATTQQRQAASQVAYNQAQVEVAKLIPQNLRTAEAQVKQLEATVAHAQAQLSLAQLNLEYTEVRAPSDGWITQRNVQNGTYLQAGQTMFLLVTTAEWVVANFKESKLDRMRIGQKVTLDVDAYPGVKLTGRVESIQMGSGSRFSAFPAENATGNFVKIVQRVPVKITLDPSDNLPMPLGLSVEPVIHLGTEPKKDQDGQPEPARNR